MPGVHLSEGFWDRLPLGKLSDHAIGKMFGLPDATVRWHRVHRGIPAVKIDYGTKMPDCSPGLLAATYAAIGTRVVVKVCDIYEVVVNTWGSVSLRGVHRALRKLVLQHKVLRVREGQAKDWGYRRCR